MKRASIAMMTTLSVLLAWPISTSWANTEEARVRHVILSVAEAVMAFPRTKDHRSVLRFYDDDFSSIEDVEEGTIQSLEQTLTKLERALSKKAPSITKPITDITIHVAGPLA